MLFIDNLHFDQNGLIPAIAQDWVDGSDCSAGGQGICSFKSGPFLPSISSF